MTGRVRMTKEQQVKYIVEVMKMRATGRKKMDAAKRKRRRKKEERSLMDWHTHLGLVDDGEFGAKPPRMRLKDVR